MHAGASCLLHVCVHGACPQVCALFLLLCSPRSLADQGRRFGRAFVMAAALATGLHVLNIALQARGAGRGGSGRGAECGLE